MDFQTLWNLAKQYGRDASPGGLLNPEVPKNAPTEVAKGLLGFTPGIGDAISGYDAVQSARQGNYGEAALNGLGLLPAIPSMGFAMHMGHAKKGGEVGLNGEFYEGGKFLPSTEAAKKAPVKYPSGGKVEVAPYIWGARPADGLQPLWNQFRSGITAGPTGALKGVPLEAITVEKRMPPDQFMSYEFRGDTKAASDWLTNQHSHVDAWNSGARYIGEDGRYYKADGTKL
jgi:hypothetical protein